MDEGRFKRTKDLFETLLELSDKERELLLSQSRAHGDATRRYVENLLKADAALAGSTVRPLLSRPDSAHSEGAPATARDRIGNRIGAFTILKELGHGGMGSVCLAERADGSVAQRVAIKIVRPERLDATTLSRFRVERQVLALLNHPNIASLIDLGELEDGAPFVVMEFVEGVPITEYVRKAGSSLVQRLELFKQLCEAVRHAHGNLIVHRDIKSSNVLVNADGRPKLIDFGIAKPLEARVGLSAGEETQTRKQFFSIGNVAPEYLTAGVSGIASDVYALGVLLYELLAGVKPFRFEDLGLAQIERQIVETDPVLPSARLAGQEAGGVGPGSIQAGDLRGDLDSIVMRCLRKQPTDRYDSVVDLIDDLDRFQRGFPVLARRGGRLYRLRRFIGRNRVLIATISTVLIFAGASLATYLIQRNSAIEERDRADQLLSLMQTALGSADPSFSRGKNMSAREMFERVAAEAEKSTGLDAHSRSLLLESVAEITFHIGEPQQALRLLEKVDMSALGDRARDDALLTEARVYAAVGDVQSARRILDAQSAISNDGTSLARWRLLETTLDIQQGNLTHAIETSRALSTAEVSDEIKDQSRMLLGDAYNALEHPIDAFHTYEQLLEDQLPRLPENHPALLRTWLALAHMETWFDLKTLVGDASSETLRISEALYGRHSLGYLDALRVRRDVFGSRSNHEDQRRVQTQVVALVDELIGADTPIALRERFFLAEETRQYGDLMRNNLLAAHESGDTPEIRSRFEEATAIYRDVIARSERILPASDYNLFMYRVVLGLHLTRRHRFAEALDALGQGLDGLDENDKDSMSHELVDIARFAHTLCAYAVARTPARLDTLEKSMREARARAHTPPSLATMKALDFVIREARIPVSPATPPDS